MPKDSSFSATMADVRSSWNPNSGWAWMSRRHAVMSSWMAAMRLMTGMASRSPFQIIGLRIEGGPPAGADEPPDFTPAAACGRYSAASATGRFMPISAIRSCV